MKYSVRTNIQINNLKPLTHKSYDVTCSNVSGLTIRVFASGVKSFRYDRGKGYKPRTVTYGRFPQLSLTEARNLHEKTKQAHQDGTLNLLHSVPSTVKELANHWYIKSVINTRSRPEAVSQILNHDIFPIIGTIKLRSVTALQVRSTVEQVIKRGATTHAGKVLAIIKQMLTYALSLDLIQFNPALAIKPASMGITNNVKTRVLADDEIAIFWNILNCNKSIVTRIALQILTLTGLRSGELRQLTWNYVDEENQTITIPVKHQKLTLAQRANSKDFVVPLSTFAMALLLELKGLHPTYVFVGKYNSCITDKVLGHYVRRVLLRPSVDLDHFTPHDLRRTFRTNLSKLKVELSIAERCLNHSLGRIIQTYDQYDFLVERRAALNKYSEYVQSIVCLPLIA
jgi:integrase